MKPSAVGKLTPAERLLYWIRERESVRLRKEAGEPPPWTDDEILGTYRFTNVRRMDDRVSQWLLQNWYKPYRDHPNMLVAVALARFVNLPASLDNVGRWFFRDGPPKWDLVKDDLRYRKSLGPVFNGAYMVRGNTKVSEDKIGTVVDEYIGSLVKADVEVDRTSMKKTHGRIAEVYGFGSFMAGQIVADLRWALTGAWRDRLRWAPVGPGSGKGMNLLHGRPAKETVCPDRFAEELTNLIELCRSRLPSSITDRLEAMDYQNCLCEFFKYEKALSGEGRPKQFYKGGEGPPATRAPQ